MLEIVNLNKSFGPSAALTDVSFHVERPQMVGLIGGRGAGKSTLLRILNGLIDASSGDVMCCERRVTGLAGAARRDWQMQCAMIFKQCNLVPHMDVISNLLRDPAERRLKLTSLLNLSTSSEQNRAETVLERLGIAEYAQTRAADLPACHEQSVALARAVMQKSDVILADEPNATFDPVNAELLMQNLRQVHEEDGRTVICALEGPDTARRYCDRVIGLRDGVIVFDCAPAQLDAAAIDRIYGPQPTLTGSVEGRAGSESGLFA